MEVYFTRPGNICEIADRLINDIKYAKKRIIGSMYSLTEHDVIKAINENPLAEKYFILNEDSSSLENCQIVVLGLQQPKIIMHHKFLIIDDVIWMGSFNVSKNAISMNWENCLRICDDEIIRNYEKEFWDMYLFGLAWSNGEIWSSTTYYELSCLLCNKKIDDPFRHYVVKADIVSEITEYYDFADYEDGPCVTGTTDAVNYRVKGYSIQCKKDDEKTKISCECCKAVEYKGKLCNIEYYHEVKKIIHESQKDELTSKESGEIVRRECWEDFGNEERKIGFKYLCRKCLVNELKKYWKYK